MCPAWGPLLDVQKFGISTCSLLGSFLSLIDKKSEFRSKCTLFFFCYIWIEAIFRHQVAGTYRQCVNILCTHMITDYMLTIYITKTDLLTANS